MNPVLHRYLYGTGLISVDLSKPIEWPDFNAQGVRQVFLAGTLLMDGDCEKRHVR